MVAVVFEPVALVKKAGMFPVPLAGKPTEGVLLVQAKLVAVPLMFMVFERSPLHIVCARGSTETFGFGSMVIVNVSISPGHVVTALKDGVTLKLAMIGCVPLFTAKKAGSVPDPAAGMPSAGWSLVQLLISAEPKNCTPLTPVP